MSKTVFGMLLLTLWAILFSCSSTVTDGQGSQVEREGNEMMHDTLTIGELQSDINQLHQLIQEKNADTLKEYLSDLVKRWNGGQVLYRQFLERSREALEGGADESMIKGFLSDLLGQHAEINVLDGYYLMNWCRFFQENAKQSVASDLEYRSNLEKAQTDFWERYDHDLDAHFDSTQLPMLNTSPPAGAGKMSGVDPSAIKDTAMRKEYEQAIDRDRKYAQYYMYQTNLRTLKKLYPSIFRTR